jgi:type I restriction enzyme, S subunit
MTNGWQEVPLGKILKRADRFEKKDELQTYRFAGTYSFARGIFAGAVKEGSTFGLDKIQRIKKGDFIYCKIMAWEGAFGIAPESVDDCVMSGAFVAYEVDQTQIDPKFLDYYFKQEPVWKSIGSHSTGTNVRRRSLHPTQFEKATIPFPPLKEQRRIVAHIESLAARVNEAQRLREEAEIEADALWASELHKLFEEYTDYTKTLNDYATFISDGTHVTPTYVDSGVPFVTVRNIANRKLTFTNLKYISQEQHEIYCKRVKPEYGDVLYTKDGTLGVPCFVDTNREFSFFVSVAIIKPKHDLLDGRYLSYILDAPQVHEQVTNTKTGAVLQHIVIRAIKAIKLPVPQLDEQRRVVAYLDRLQAKVNALRELQSASGEELSALMPSVLDRAFKGEL